MMMHSLIENINSYLQLNSHAYCERSLCSQQLASLVRCYTSLYTESLTVLSQAFEAAIPRSENSKHSIIINIIENDSLFSDAVNTLSFSNLTHTDALQAFNNATLSTSVAKCSYDKSCYIMRCYNYFFYIFDKNKHEGYILLRNEKKAITMVNILLLTPYLMFGELYAVHGGLVSDGKNNLLISNDSLGGKTTFSILFASNGWNIITEETTYITPKGYILPYNIRNYFNIRVGTYLAFLDYFKKRDIINEHFLEMQGLDYQHLYDYGKQNQLSIDFERLGSVHFNNISKITHFIRVAIKKDAQLKIEPMSFDDCSSSFLKLSLAPTVLLFEELLDYHIENYKCREQSLNEIFKQTQRFSVISDLNYREHFTNMMKVFGI